MEKSKHPETFAQFEEATRHALEALTACWQHVDAARNWFDEGDRGLQRLRLVLDEQFDRLDALVRLDESSKILFEEIRSRLSEVLANAQTALARCGKEVLLASGEFVDCRDTLRRHQQQIRRLQWLGGERVQRRRHHQTDYVSAVVSAITRIGHPARSDDIFTEFHKTNAKASKKTFTKALKRCWREGRLVHFPDCRSALPAWSPGAAGATTGPPPES